MKQKIREVGKIAGNFHKLKYFDGKNFCASFHYLGHEKHIKANSETKLFDLIFDFVESTTEPKTQIISNMLATLRVKYQDKKIKIIKDEDADSFVIGMVEDLIEDPKRGLVVFLHSFGTTKEIPIKLLTQIQIIE